MGTTFLRECPRSKPSVSSPLRLPLPRLPRRRLPRAFWSLICFPALLRLSHPPPAPHGREALAGHSPPQLCASPMYSTEPSVKVHCDESLIAVTRYGNYQCVESVLYNPTSPITLRQTKPDLTVTSLCPCSALSTLTMSLTVWSAWPIDGPQAL